MMDNFPKNALEFPPRCERQDQGRALTVLAELPPKTLQDEAALARVLAVGKRTIRRMVNRGELPPPVRFGGRATWMAGRILAHFEARAERAARRAEREARRLEGLTVPRPEESGRTKKY